MKRGIIMSEHFDFTPEKVLKMDEDKKLMEVSSIVDHKRISKNSALSLVELAKEIEKANSYVKSSTCSKLKTIADQISYLQQQAQCILTEAQRDICLHDVSCNFVKQLGHIYHLYERNSGELYFSMISPEEWGKSGPSQQYKGSFRIEHDRSWTPISKIPQVDSQMKPIEQVVEKIIFNNYPVSSLKTPSLEFTNDFNTT